jgi:hypothetical protein
MSMDNPKGCRFIELLEFIGRIYTNMNPVVPTISAVIQIAKLIEELYVSDNESGDCNIKAIYDRLDFVKDIKNEDVTKWKDLIDLIIKDWEALQK